MRMVWWTDPYWNLGPILERWRNQNLVDNHVGLLMFLETCPENIALWLILKRESHILQSFSIYMTCIHFRDMPFSVRRKKWYHWGYFRVCISLLVSDGSKFLCITEDCIWGREAEGTKIFWSTSGTLCDIS